MLIDKIKRLGEVYGITRAEGETRDDFKRRVLAFAYGAKRPDPEMFVGDFSELENRAIAAHQRTGIQGNIPNRQEELRLRREAFRIPGFIKNSIAHVYVFKDPARIEHEQRVFAAFNAVVPPSYRLGKGRLP